MDKKEIGVKIKSIRKALMLNQPQFVALYNATKPVSITTTVKDVSRYERATNGCPSEKYRKFLKLDRG